MTSNGPEVDRRVPRRSARLALALEPFLPNRAFEVEDQHIRYGYDLRLSGGARVSSRDPLLRAFGAEIATVDPSSSQLGDLQHEDFSPGNEVSLAAEHGADGAGVMVVRDVSQVRCGGRIDGDSAAVALAAISQGLEQNAVVLDEVRSTVDDLRLRVRVVIHAERFVRLNHRSAAPYMRPTMRRRLLLIVDSDYGVRWWDDHASIGPAPLDHVPISDELRNAHRALRRAAKKLHKKRAERSTRVDRYEVRRSEDRLERRAQRLWLIARKELGHEYLIGFIAPGMGEPVWTPQQLEIDVEGDWQPVEH
jgi:hypothetical protein